MTHAALASLLIIQHMLVHASRARTELQHWTIFSQPMSKLQQGNVRGAFTRIVSAVALLWAELDHLHCLLLVVHSK